MMQEAGNERDAGDSNYSAVNNEYEEEEEKFQILTTTLYCS